METATLHGMSKQPDAASTPPPLIVSADRALRDEAGRLAAAAGVTALVVSTATDVRQVWSPAPVVLVGDDMAAELAGLQLPRRQQVFLVAAEGSDPASWRRALAIGAEQVISLPADRHRVVEVLAAGGEGVLARLFAVTGACGGAGASVFAAALASTASRRGESVALVDVDPWGGGLDLLVGGEQAAGLRGPDLATTSGRIDATSLRDVLPVVDDLALLSWGRDDPVPVSRASMRTVLAAARRGHQLVVADVPRLDDDAAREALALATCTVLVVPAEVRAVAAARTRLGLLRRATADLRLVVRASPSRSLDGEAVADALELPLLVEMRPERALAGWLDQGLGPIRKTRGPLARACSSTLTALAQTEPSAA